MISMAYDQKQIPPSLAYPQSNGFRNITKLKALQFEAWY